MTTRCNYCNKQYTNKSAFTRHQFLCEFASYNERSKKVYIEETKDLPSHSSMVFAMQDMLSKMNKMESRIDFLEKENSILQKIKMRKIPVSDIFYRPEEAQPTTDHPFVKRTSLLLVLVWVFDYHQPA